MKKFILTICFCLIASISFAEEYYIGQWVWNDDPSSNYWEAPVQEYNTGAIDLRNIPDQSIKGGTPKGYAIFSYSQLVTDPNLEHMGGDLDEAPNKKAIGAIQRNLGLAHITSLTIRDILWKVLTVEADPTGNLRVKPLMPGVNGKMELYLGRAGKIKEVALVPYESPEWDNVLAVIHNDYKELLETEPYYVIAKVLDFWEDKYNLPYKTFIPDGVIQIASLPHETTINETWGGCNDSDSLNCDLTWTELSGDIDIVSNEASSVTTSYARAESDLSSSDNYAQADVNAPYSTNCGVGVATRFSSSATTFYGMAFARYYGKHYIEKVVAGSGTKLSAGDNPGSLNAGIFKIEADGDTLTSYFNGGQSEQLTDSSITVGIRSGIKTSSPSNTITVDDFEAADLAAPVTAPGLYGVTIHGLTAHGT